MNINIMTPEIFDAICYELSISEKTTADVCRGIGVEPGAFFGYLLRGPDTARKQYDIAMESQIEVLIASIRELENECMEVVQSVSPRLAGTIMKTYQMQIENRKWIAGKLKSRKYGEISRSENINLTLQAIPAVLEHRVAPAALIEVHDATD